MAAAGNTARCRQPSHQPAVCTAWTWRAVPRRDLNTRHRPVRAHLSLRCCSQRDCSSVPVGCQHRVHVLGESTRVASAHCSACFCFTHCLHMQAVQSLGASARRQHGMGPAVGAVAGRRTQRRRSDVPRLAPAVAWRAGDAAGRQRCWCAAEASASWRADQLAALWGTASWQLSAVPSLAGAGPLVPSVPSASRRHSIPRD